MADTGAAKETIPKNDIADEMKDDSLERKRQGPDGRVASEEGNAKRQRKDENQKSEVQHKPLEKPPSDPVELKTAIRKQIEFYFSDANMQHDKFFQDKIKQDAESWLNVGHLLSCRNIKRLEVTQPEAIVDALQGSHLETKKDDNGSMWVRRLEPLPPLVDGGRQKKPKKEKPQKVIDMTVFHDVGCFSKATNCPEECSWEQVKSALAAKLPSSAKIRFASQIQQDGTCYIYCFKFENDKQIFTNKLTLDIAGGSVEVSLLTDAAEATKVVKSILPAHIAQQRERVLNPRGRSPKNVKGAKGGNSTLQPPGPPVPIKVGATDFKSVNHLRDCVKELLAKTTIGTVLPKEKLAFKVISEVLKYHPKAEEKTKNMVGLKVDQICKDDKPTKCFFVLKQKEGEEEPVAEDFSVLKCLAELQANPPVVKGDEATGGGDTADDKEDKTEAAGVEEPKKGGQEGAACEEALAS